MPSWGVHLSIAKKVSEKYKVDSNMFYFASLAPDIDYGSNWNRVVAHFYTDKKYDEFKEEYIIDHELFLHKYRSDIKNSFVLGYYVHLLTDYYFNTYFFKKYWIADENKNVIGIRNKDGENIICSLEDRKNYKHKDFDSFSKYLSKKDKIKDLYYDENILISSKIINQYLYTKDAIKRRMEYVNNDLRKINSYSFKEKLCGLSYKIITQKECVELYDKTLDFIYSKLDEIGVEKI